jgi:hypothetical protein
LLNELINKWAKTNKFKEINKQKNKQLQTQTNMK